MPKLLHICGGFKRNSYRLCSGNLNCLAIYAINVIANKSNAASYVGKVDVVSVNLNVKQMRQIVTSYKLTAYFARHLEVMQYSLVIIQKNQMPIRLIEKFFVGICPVSNVPFVSKSKLSRKLNCVL